MRKPITILLALLIALSPVLAYAETMNFAALLASEDNKNLGNEDGVYNALYKILMKANGKDFPLNDWILASTCLSKNAIGEELSPVETVFDESLSAYEKFFLLNLANATLTDDEAQALTDVFDRGLREYPEDGQELYVATEEDGYISGLMREATEKLGFKFEPETINETLTLYAVKDKDDKVIFSAPEVLTSLPHAILMKHVPAEKKQESAAALARVEAAIPYKIDWHKITSGDDVAFDDLDSMDEFFEASDEDEDEADEEDADKAEKAEEVELTEEQVAEWTEKWMKLFFACDAYDAQPDEANYKLLTEALLGMSEEKPEVTQEDDGGISLRFDETTNPAATPAPSTKKASSGSSSTNSSTKKELVDLKPPYTAYTGQYIIYVSKKTCTIAIIGRGSDNRFTKKVKTFPAAVGKAGQTRDGIFWLTKKERWHSWSGGTYSPYSVKQDGGSYIHGPMYTAKDSTKMIASSYNAIGTQSSAGCLSTVCAAAGWIYYNCPVGTMVWINNDSKFKSSKPKKIPADQTYDPTESNVKPTAVDPGTTATTTPAPASSSSSGSSGSTTNNTTKPTATPEPSLETLDIKQVQSLLIFYGTDVDMSSEIAQGVMGDNTRAAMNKFRAAYNTLPGVDQLKTDVTAETKATVTALLNALMTQDVVKNAISAVQDNLIKVGKLTAADKQTAQAATIPYDQKTADAIALFQQEKAASGLVVSGVADLATQILLNQAANPGTDTPTPDTKALQSIEVTPAKTEIDVGEITELSVSATPSDIDVTYEYALSPEDFITVSDGKVTAVSGGSADTDVTITVTPKVADASVANNAASVSVTITVKKPSFETVGKSGSANAAAKEVQAKLVAIGKLTSDTPSKIKSAIDGIYGDKTAAAVESFQSGKDNLAVTGTVNQATYDALTAAYKAAIKSKVQEKLIALGSLSESQFEENGGKLVKGVYDETTQAKVVEFQKSYNASLPEDADASKKLNEDGIPDAATQKALADAAENKSSTDGEEPQNTEPEAPQDGTGEGTGTTEPTEENKPAETKDNSPAEKPAETKDEQPEEKPATEQTNTEDTDPAPAENTSSDTEKTPDATENNTDETEAEKKAAEEEAAKEEAAKKAAEEEAAKKAAEEKAAEEAAKKAAEEKAAEEAAKKAAEEKAAEEAAKKAAEEKAAEEAAKKAAEEKAAEEAAKKAAEEAAASVAEAAEANAE